MKKQILGNWALASVLLPALGAIVLQFMAAQAQAPDKARYWECFPRAEVRYGPITQINEDSQGRIWITANGRIFFMDAAKRNWITTTLRSDTYLEQIHGGPKTGLYATQVIVVEEDKSNVKKTLTGDVFLLDQGDPTPVTQFVYNDIHAYPGFHVLGRNRFLNWCRGKIRIYANGNWIEHQADVWQQGVILFQCDDQVGLLFNRKLYVIDAANKLKVHKLDSAIPDQKSPRYAMLGKQTAAVFESGKPFIKAFNVLNGDEVELTKVNAMIGGRLVYGLDSTPDGSLWITLFTPATATVSADPNPKIMRVAPDGTPSMFGEIVGDDWPFKSTCSVVEPDGTLWCHNLKSILRLSGGRVEQFDSRYDGSPSNIGYSIAYAGSIFCDSKGIIYAGGNNGELYAYNHGESLTGEPRFQATETVEVGQPTWRYESQVRNSFTRAWHVDDLIVCAPLFNSPITAINVADGKVRFSIPVEREYDDDSVSAVASETPGQIFIYCDGKMLTVDSKSGNILATVVTKRDKRIPPIGVREGFIVAPEFRGDSLVRFNSDGIKLWESRLGGCYPQVPPTEWLSLLVTQTRSGSNSGQKILAIDSETGEKIWEKATGASGVGVVFMKDATRMVEMNYKIARNTLTTQIIARESISGELLWTFEAKGRSDQGPVVDLATDRIYCSFTDGAILCIDGSNGELVWRSAIPTTPAGQEIGGDYWRNFSGMFLVQGKICIMGSDQMLYQMDTNNGRVLKRLKLFDDVIQRGLRLDSRPLVAGPWVIGDQLIVPTCNGIHSYPISVITD